MESLDPLLGRTLVLVAHPDDEVIGCGGLLGRMRSSIVVFATDGAPRDRSFWSRFGSREAYAHTRKQEALLVAKLAGVDEIRFLCDGRGNQIADQELFRNLAAGLEQLRQIVAEMPPDVLLTPAYEGGHPDHDCCNFLAAIVAGEFHLQAWEMPLYHRTADGEVRRQHFLEVKGHELVYDLSESEQTTKRLIVDAYRSQDAVLKHFSLATERFRLLPAYDYSQPPHQGVLNYEAWGWPVNGGQVTASFQRSLAQLEERRQARVL